MEDTENRGHAIYLPRHKEIAISFISFSVSFVGRDANQVAHLRSKNGGATRRRYTWMSFLKKWKDFLTTLYIKPIGSLITTNEFIIQHPYISKPDKTRKKNATRLIGGTRAT
jgi:hypothetical protein